MPGKSRPDRLEADKCLWRGTIDTEVLIIGAGPSGLALALWLTRLGVRVRIIDRALQSSGAPRAFSIQARTLEFYDQLGLAREMIARGRVIADINVHIGREPARRVPFGDFGQGLSPFPYILLLLQDDHEKLLLGRLSTAGVEVERGVELIDLDDDGVVVRARLAGPAGTTQVCEARFVCGCDGISSTARELVGIKFPGTASEEMFYVADVAARGAMVDGALHYLMSGPNICSVFPLRGEGRVRLIGLTPASVRESQFRIGFGDVASYVEADAGLAVSVVESFATYRVHHGIADQWRRGRVFLLGEACHVHSPSGGQGLNAGVGDAVNLAWKLVD
jgi:2-polyprenyl-6-methoxyphenol hydroxylase-like FAD-dependent oxidoreductase